MIPLTTFRSLTVATVLAAETALLQPPIVLGLLLMLWFLVIVPGTLAVDLLRLPTTGLERVVIVVAASFAIDTLCTLALLYAGVWTPRVGALALTAFCGALLAYGAMSRSRVGRFD